MPRRFKGPSKPQHASCIQTSTAQEQEQEQGQAADVPVGSRSGVDVLVRSGANHTTVESRISRRKRGSLQSMSSMPLDILFEVSRVVLQS